MTVQIERNAILSELVSFPPSYAELMAGFIANIEGSIPIEGEKFAAGIAMALVKAPFLWRFIEDGMPTPAATEALCILEKEGLIKRDDSNWVIPESKAGIDTPENRLNSKVRLIFKQPGIEMLKAAGQAAKEVWSKYRA